MRFLSFRNYIPSYNEKGVMSNADNIKRIDQG